MQWSITSTKVNKAVRKISAFCHPRQIIIFGSYAAGRLNANSDVDILVVVEDGVKNPRQESVQIRHALRDISMPMDILVVPVSHFQQLKNTPGLIYREAVSHGKIVYEAA